MSIFLVKKLDFLKTLDNDSPMMKNGAGWPSYVTYKKDILSLFEESTKDIRKDVKEIKETLTNHLSSDHKKINEKLEKLEAGQAQLNAGQAKLEMRMDGMESKIDQLLAKS